MKNSWENALIESSNTLRDALQIISKEALRVALVVDESSVLKGVVSDGDIRRALLRGIGLDSSVEEVMNSHPVTVTLGANREDIINIMHEKDLLFIPIIDSNNVLIGLETLHNALVNKAKHLNPVFIMAGGFGTRLRPLTDHCPKPMLEIGGKPILETILKSFIKFGFERFYISTHYMSDQIRSYFGDGSKFGISISYVHEESPLGTGGALGLLPDDLPKDLPLIMMNGDVLTKVNFERLLNFHVQNKADATMCVRDFEYQIPYGVITGEGDKIKSMEEKPVQRFFVNAGIYIVSPKIVESVPKNHPIDMPTLLQKHMDERDNILMFPIHEYWLDIGRMDDFNRAQSDIYTLEME